MSVTTGLQVLEPNASENPPPADPASAQATLSLPTAADQAASNADGPRTIPASIHQPSILETCFGLAVIPLWTVLFASGVIFPSEPYRTRLTNPKLVHGVFEVSRDLFLFITSYT